MENPEIVTLRDKVERLEQLVLELERNVYGADTHGVPNRPKPWVKPKPKVTVLH